MKKSKKTLLTALTLMSSVSMTSCFYAVYGPPPDEDKSVSSSSLPTNEYDPYYDSFQPEYGVPEDYDTTEEIITTDNEYKPEDEEISVVYGPPSDME